MRTIKFIVLALLGLVLVTIGAGNMAPVDLHLVPARVAGGAFTLSGVPLAGVILASVLFGIVVGQLLEWLRERKYRRLVVTERREIGALSKEVTRLKSKAGETDDLPILKAQ